MNKYYIFTTLGNSNRLKIQTFVSKVLESSLQLQKYSRY